VRTLPLPILHEGFGEVFVVGAAQLTGPTARCLVRNGSDRSANRSSAHDLRDEGDHHDEHHSQHRFYG